jgi:two-component system, cell cycle sensor histidine kinase and response regulator CckA
VKLTFEVLAQISASVAHDFNNSLQVIMADASAIEMAREGDRSVRDIAGEISDMCRDSSLIARQLLTLGQRVVLEPRVTDLGKEVGSALRAAERLLPSTIAVEFDLPLGHFARVDRVQLKQAILNLAINAGHAMPQGGVLRVELFSANSSEEKLVVSDTGVGMNADTASRIFDPFFTTKGAQGTGLGLATVSAIMHQHGGRIEVESQVNRGTRFELTFPSVSAGESESSEPSMLMSGLGGVRILVVDDDRRVLRAMQEMLGAFGAEVIAVDSGEKALRELHAATRPFNVLCTDAVMPGLPARELIAQVRRDFAGLPILLCSAYVESDLLRRGVETREQPFLAKPFSAEQLVRKIHGLLDSTRRAEGCAALVRTV